MDISTKMERNVTLLRWQRTARMFMIAMAVIVPYYQSLGLSIGQITTLQAFFTMTVVVLEVPSGHFADTFGRKRSIVLGQLFWLLGWAAYPFAGGFASLALAEVLLGIGVALVSGADDSLRYDSLLHLKDEGRNLREDSRANAFGAFGEGFAGLLGGALAVISLQAPIFGQGVWVLLMTPLVFFLTEAPRSTRESTQHPWRAVLEVSKYTLHSNVRVKWLVLYTAILSTTTYTAVWLMQPFYEEVGVPIAAFGALWFTKHVFLGGFGLHAEQFRTRLGLRRALIVLPIVGFVSYTLLGAFYTLWIMPAWIGFELVRAMQNPIIRDEINKLIPSDFRATVLSVQGLVTRLFYAVFGITIGYLADTFGVRATLIISAAVYAPLGLLVLIGLLKNGHDP